MSKTYSAGIVTAYGAAKRAGYTGTYEDFCRQQAGYAESAAAVETAKNTAVSAANTATAKATEATTAATAAQTAKERTEAAASQALTDIGTARSGAISAVQTEGQTQTSNARAQALAAAQSATTASTKASEASASATTATTKATEADASATSAAQSASSAQSVLDSIPEDYSDLSKDVGQLKADLEDTTKDIAIGFSNIFDDAVLLTTGISNDGYHTFKGTAKAFHNAFNATPISVAAEQNKVYKLSFSAKCDTSGLTGSGITFVFVYSDFTWNNAVIVPNSTTSETRFEAFSSRNKTLSAIGITYGSNGDNVWDVSNIMLMPDTTATEFIPYLTAHDRYSRAKINEIQLSLNHINEINQIVCGALLPEWVTCDIDITASGWTYFLRTIGVNARRIAPAEGKPIILQQGDTIGLTSYADAWYCLAWRVGTTYYTLGTWQTSDYVATQSGEYVMLIAHQDNRLISSISELSSLFKYDIKDIADEIEELKDRAGTNVPTYWENALETAFETIRNNKAAIGARSEEFYFVTDTHWENNAQNSGKLLSWLTRKTEIPTVIFGGDAYNGEKTTIQSALDTFWSFYDAYNLPGIELYTVEGNHDSNAPQSDQTLLLNAGQVYAVMYKREETRSAITDTGNVIYFDNENQKTRIITFKTIWTLTDTVYTEIARLVNELDADWTVVLVSHMYWDTSDSDNLPIARTSMTAAGQQLAALKASATATVACWIVGHVHQDYDAVINGLQVIGVTTDCYRQNYNRTTMTRYTDTEQAFDCVQIDLYNKVIHMTRIGAGNNRQFSYT